MRLDVEGLDVAEEGIYRLGVGAKPGVRELVGRSTERAARGMADRAPTWRGDLKRSIHTSYTARGDVVTGEAATDASYAAATEVGTGPQGPTGGRYFPPGPALEEWAIDHGFESGWQLAHIIYLKGTRPAYFTRATVESMVGRQIEPEIDRFWDQISG